MRPDYSGYLRRETTIDLTLNYYRMKKTTLLGWALALLLLGGKVETFAQVTITMTTSKAVGESLAFAVNKGADLTVDWGNGTPVTLKAGAEQITGELAGTTVTVTSPLITTFDCSGNGLTALSIKAPELRSLTCSHNELTALSLSEIGKVEQLDVSHNKLTTLSFLRAKGVIELLCNDNEISALVLTNTPKLRTLWCQNNQLKTLNVSQNPLLESLVADNNILTKFTVNTNSGLPALKDMWCANNQLSNLNLTYSAHLETINYENNGLEAINIASQAGKPMAIYCGGNKLDLRHFFTARGVAHYEAGQQAPFALSAKEVNIGEQLEAPDMSLDGEGNSTGRTYKWYTCADSTELKKGSSRDYKVPTAAKPHIFTFNKAFDAIFCAVTATNFKGITLYSEPLKVVDPEVVGLREATAKSGFTYNIQGNQLRMTADEPIAVRVTNLAGKIMWTGVVDASGAYVTLPRGIYLVNHIKVII